MIEEQYVSVIEDQRCVTVIVCDELVVTVCGDCDWELSMGTNQSQ